MKKILAIGIACALLCAYISYTVVAFDNCLNATADEMVQTYHIGN